MFKKAAMVPLQHPDVFAKIVKVVKDNQFDQMMKILQKNKLDLGEVEVYQKIWNTVVDAYFEEKEFPIELLQKLLKVGNVEDFLERYHSSNQETKEMMVMQTCITASDYPEMML